MQKLACYFMSRSDRSKKYKTIRHADGRITCNCPGWIFSGKNRHCRHAERALSWAK